MIPESHIYKQLLQRDFYAFVARSFLTLNPQTSFIPADFLRLLAAKLQECVEGKTRRLVINVPPRHLKSVLASIALPAFWLGHHPSANIMCVSYSQELAELFARQTRQIMQEPWYLQTFNTRIAASKNAVHEFTTTRGGSRVAVSNGGTITGRGADLIILDDPLKPEDALSETMRNGVNSWYSNTLISRLNNKETACIIVVMQRLHEQDLTGFLLEGEEWEVLSLPAIAEEDECYPVMTPMGPFTYQRTAGNVLIPERESRGTLMHMREIMGEYNFQSQYQQNPIPKEGICIKLEYFQTYHEATMPTEFDCIAQSWDTASTVSELSDYSVCTTWGINGKYVYLLHVLRERMEFPQLKRTIISHMKEFNANVVLIENRSSGIQLIQDLKHDGVYQVVPCNPPQCEKIMRLHTQLPTIEGGFVLIPEKAPWLGPYLRELTTFPGGKHDDQVDSTVQFLTYLKSIPAEPALLTVMKMEAAERGIVIPEW